MQEYRINYTLLIGLIVGTFVCSGAIYGLHQFQNSRQSGWLISEAEKAIAEKNYREAAQYYQQYISIHTDDLDAKIKLANTYLDLVEQDDVDPEDFPAAMQSLETMLRNPDHGRCAGNQKRPPSARRLSTAKTMSATTPAPSTISSCCSKAIPTTPTCRFFARPISPSPATSTTPPSTRTS